MKTLTIGDRVKVKPIGRKGKIHEVTCSRSPGPRPTFIFGYVIELDGGRREMYGTVRENLIPLKKKRATAHEPLFIQLMNDYAEGLESLLRIHGKKVFRHSTTQVNLMNKNGRIPPIYSSRFSIYPRKHT